MLRDMFYYRFAYIKNSYGKIEFQTNLRKILAFGFPKNSFNAVDFPE